MNLGPESDLMPPARDNPDGFWENESFVAMNDELLNELGGAWDLPPRSRRFAGKRFDAMRAKGAASCLRVQPAKGVGLEGSTEQSETKGAATPNKV
jgi:hypothetical protein